MGYVSIDEIYYFQLQFLWCCSLRLLVNKTNNGPGIAEDFFKDVVVKVKRIKNIYYYMK